ncbi:hypothetical protein BST81_19480 [Leptolyngbya sp. 'hensonii']|uniref:hypothetical protein n=1 Tax=Leptolyngbya sp. 'hensonii' TaxID=1922337 RepID=UPI00094F9ED2|nr:hypothetical protein [Leptolyngbya sp. 'hensonii']OLP16875.1 hypothetical protein BST81_19480 [Leptolyngbya sp. 'hensonii']
MSQPIPDLWPDFGETNLITPLTILKAQATALAKKTNGLVEATVTSSSEANGDFIHRFYLVAPVLDYRYHLLTVFHDIKLYPLRIEFLIEGLQSKLGGSLKDEAAFESCLTNIFASEKTIQIIRALISQSRVATV